MPIVISGTNGISGVDGTASNPSYEGTDSNTGIFFPAADTVAIGTGGSERMRIDSSGNLLKNTTSTISTGSNTDTGIQLSANNQAIFMASGGPAVLIARNGSTGEVVRFGNQGTGDVGSIDVTTSSTSYTTSSDYRLKENVQPMTGALAKVAALKPVTYTWKADGSDGEGFIAHELAEVVPDCVTGDKDAVDADGNPIYQGVDTSFLVATLTAAIQELKAELDATKAEVAALKGA
jgi:hypothetical protein